MLSQEIELHTHTLTTHRAAATTAAHIRSLLPKRPIKEFGPLNQSAVQISIGKQSGMKNDLDEASHRDGDYQTEGDNHHI